MIYNRYIPGSDGIYKRHSVSIPDNQTPNSSPKTPQPQSESDSPHRNSPTGIDLGDILLLCIVILLICESEGNDTLSIIAAIAAFYFIQ